MTKLLSILFVFLLACQFPNETSEPVQLQERTLWDVCWSDKGDVLVPPDFAKHNPNCIHTEKIKWTLPITVGYKNIPKYYHLYIERSLETWNSAVGTELFVVEHKNPKITVSVIPPTWYWAAAFIQKNPTLTGQVKVGLDAWNNPRLYFTLVHEFGHILGLAHDKERDSWMFSGDRFARMRIRPADIQALRALYNVRQ